MIEKRSRSFLKAVSWRLAGSVDTLLISFLITGRWSWAVTIGGVEFFTKLALYYFHERLWEHIPYGRAVAAEPAAEAPPALLQNSASTDALSMRPADAAS